MTTDRSGVSHRLLQRDLEGQGPALATCLPGLRADAARVGPRVGTGRVTLVGSGDSLYAGLALEAFAAVQLGRRWSTASPEAVCRACDQAAGDTVIAVSFSGSGSRTVDAARQARDAGALTIAVTAAPDGPLAAVCHDVVIIGHQSPSRAIPHATDFSTTLLAVACLLEAIGGVEVTGLDLLADLVVRTTSSQLGFREQLVADLRLAERTFLLAVGDGLGVARYGAAKLWEAGGYLAWASDLEEFGHGLHLVARSDDLAVVVAPDGRMDRVVALIGGLRSLGLRTWTVGPGELSDNHLPTVVDDPRLGAFSAVVPLQQLCLWKAQIDEADVTSPPTGVPEHGRYQAYREVVAAASPVE